MCLVEFLDMLLFCDFPVRRHFAGASAGREKCVTRLFVTRGAQDRHGFFPPRFGLKTCAVDIEAASFVPFWACVYFWEKGQNDAQGAISPLRVRMDGG